jgi:predicted TPR repeat methyltransferase
MNNIEEVTLGQAVALFKQGKPDEAQSLFLSILNNNSKNPDALYFMSMIDHQSGRSEVAEYRANELLLQKPTDGKALNLLGTILMSQGKLNEAEEHFTKGMRYDKENPALYVNSAICNIGLGQPDKSIERCKVAISLNPEYMNAYNILGNSYLAKSQYQLAAESFEKALQLNPDFQDARFNLGKANLELGQLDNAKQNFEAIVETTQHKAHALNGIADVLSLQKKNTEAAEYYDQAIKQNADFAPAYVGLGKILLKLNEPTDAISHFKRALEINPNNLEALIYSGDALRKLNKLEAAAAAFNDALNIDPENAQAKFHLATVQEGSAPVKPENDYIRRLFDDFAETFDEDLAKVDYNVPKQLAELAEKHIDSANDNSLDIIDIGCGTGLCGIEFKQFSNKLKGIDISPRMIQATSKRGIYDEVEESEILAALVKHQNDTDIIVSADVFIYFGDLESVFLAVTSALRDNGLFFFSVESHTDDDDFKLPVTARYTHSKKYILELAKRRGLEIISCDDSVIRQESGSPVNGLVVALRK